MKLTIARKLFIAFGVVWALLAIVGLLGVFSLTRARAAAAELSEAQTVMEAVDRSLGALLRERVALGHVWATGETGEIAYAEEARTEFEAAWEIVRTNRAEEIPGMIRGIELEQETYAAIWEEAVALHEANPGDVAAVTAKIEEADGFFLRTLEPQTELLRVWELARVQQVQASVRRLVDIMVAVAAVAGGIALVVGAAAAYIISRGITRAASHLSAAAESISRGDLDTPIEVRTGDEMQILAESIERMRASLKAAIERLRKRQATA